MGGPPDIFTRWFVPVAALCSFVSLFLIPYLPGKVQATAGTISGCLFIVWILLLLRRGVCALNRKSLMGRVVRLELHPLLGRALKPLRPSSVELAGVLHDLRSQGKQVGRVVQRDAILAEMDCLS